MVEKTMEKIVALAKSRGFVYPGSEIYGGLANTWDYGNLGVELKNNVKKAWWQKFVQESPYNVGVDCAILMNPQTWVASGHLGGFSDPLMDCKACKERFRADKLIEDYMSENGIEIEGSIDGWPQEEMKKYIDEHVARGKYKDAICDLLVKLQYDLWKLLQADRETQANELIDNAVANKLISKPQADALHKLRMCRNGFQHPERKQIPFDKPTIENWRDIVFMIGGQK